MKEYLSTERAENGFYPTPQALVDKMLEGIDWKLVHTVLEPSAGKGNIINGIGKCLATRDTYNNESISADCIEIDPYLRSIIEYEYGKHEEELRDELNVLNEKRRYNYHTNSTGQTPEEDAHIQELRFEIEKRENISVHVVHDDFLTFDSRKQYDLIAMNPPFADGDAHLLKAISLQERNGGMIRCLLNEKTLLNAYSNRRKKLKAKLEELGAKIQSIGHAFAEAERETDVSVVLISIDIAAPHRESEFYNRLRRAAKLDDVPVNNVADMVVTDFLNQIVSRFNVEVDAGIALIREYEAMMPYLTGSFTNEYADATLTLCVGNRTHRGEVPDVNKFLRLVRKKYWSALFSNKEFVGTLTSNLREKYRGMIDQMENYDFTLYNIQQVAVQMNAEINIGIQDTIVALFDRMTQKHTWYPEMEKNVHYYDGWKTNKAHKINSKVILPVNGMFSDYSWSRDTFNVNKAESTISDIEKVFDYLDGNMTTSVDLGGVLRTACESGTTRGIPCKYFDVTLYKKGTMHLKFRNQELVDRFNIYCCRRKNWLPPAYGKTKYHDMTRTEQAIVDGFNGDGTQGSGETAYMTVIANPGYYLCEPKQNVPMLTE